MDPGDNELAHLLGNFQLEEVADAIPDDQLLTIINDSRLIERRPAIDSLPLGFIDLNQYQRLELVKRITKDFAVHEYLKTNLEDDGYICLNKTELKLIELNRAVLSNIDNVPVERLQYNQIDPDDYSYYYPTNTDKQVPVFVTDSDCRLISTPTYVSAGQCFISKHKLHQTFHITDSVLNFETLNLIHSTPIRVPTPSSSSNSSSVTINSSQEEIDWQRKYIQLLHKYARKRPRMSENESEASKVNQDTIDTLIREKKELEKQLAQSKTGKPVPVAKSEREEISALNVKLNFLTTLLEKQLKIDLGTASLEAASGIKTGESVLNDIYKLKYPENIIPITDDREQETLAILKPSVIANTIGTFDPDTNPKVDFRGMWERTLEHTKNAPMYEHEYLSILRMVMKGTSANQLDKMSKEFNGDLKEILEAIQDLYIPQMTFFDEYDELNNFSRGKKEHIRTTVRRAALAVYPIKATVAEAAWADRKYNLLMQIIKQVIDKKTFSHLRMEELKCAHAGSQLSIDAVINCISLYETTNNLIPTNDIKLSYNVNTMQLANQPDKNQTELEELRNELAQVKTSIKSLAPKRPRYDKSVPQNDRPKAKGKRRLEQKTQPMQVDPHASNRGVKRQAENEKPNYPVVPYQGQQNKQGQPQKPPYRPQQNVQPYVPPKPSNYQSNTGGYNTQGRTGQQSGYTNRGYNTRGRGYRGRGRGKRTYQFQRDKHDVVLNFYKCEVCPNMHPEGSACNDQQQNGHLNE
ncbi:MAG: hypothetical protein RLZZ574_2162 [Cyanobacteriota bacterium]